MQALQPPIEVVRPDFDLYDPRDPATIEDPYPAFRRLRDEAPVYKLLREEIWVISRYADVESSMLDWHTFSSAKGNVIYEDPARIGRTLTTNDPPRHDQLRRLIGAGYTPGRVKAHEARIAQLVNELVEKVDPRGFDYTLSLHDALPIYRKSVV